MNNEQQQIIDESYNNYLTYIHDVVQGENQIYGDWYGKEEFINKCKTNPEFSEKWGLKIEERELSEEERWRIRFDYYPKDKQFPWDRMALPSHRFLDDFNIPRRLITITRELSEDEIWDYIHKNKIEILHQHAVLYSHAVGSEYRKSFIPTLIVHYNIPTKETIESYE
jgi:hypothetical protein